MKTFTKEYTPAEVVNIFPKASDLFKEYDINFCCKGDRPLYTVLEELNMKETTLLDELNERYENWRKEDHEVTDWESKSLSDVIDYIVDTYHAFLHEELLPLEQFVIRVYFRHGDDQPHLIELNNLYNDFKILMEQHLLMEENELFPLIKEFEQNPRQELSARLEEVIRILETEHAIEVDMLNKMREMTNGFYPPAEACNTYRIAYARLAELEENTLQHIHLENNVLLKRVKEIINK